MSKDYFVVQSTLSIYPLSIFHRSKIKEERFDHLNIPKKNCRPLRVANAKPKSRCCRKHVSISAESYSAVGSAPSVTRFQGSKGGSQGSFSRRQTAIFARKREGRRGLVRFPGPARVLNNADHLLSLPEISRESSSDLTAQEPTLRGIVSGGEERWCPRCPVKPRGKRPRTMIIIIIMIKITIIIIMAVEKVEASGGGSWRRWRRRRHEES